MRYKFRGVDLFILGLVVVILSIEQPNPNIRIIGLMGGLGLIVAGVLIMLARRRLKK